MQGGMLTNGPDGSELALGKLLVKGLLQSSFRHSEHLKLALIERALRANSRPNLSGPELISIHVLTQRLGHK